MIGNLESVMKMNGTFFKGFDSESYLSELNENFNYHNDNQISSFRALVDTSHGLNAFIDGNETKVLIKELEGKVVISAEIHLIKEGSLVEIKNKHLEDEIYLVTGRLIDKTDYIEAEAKLCNQFINTKNIKNIPCYFTYTLEEGDKSSKVYEYEGRAKVYIQKPKVKNLFKLKSRLIFNNSKEEIFEIIDINATEFKNVNVLLVQKTKYMNEDDLINNIGYEIINNEEVSNEVDKELYEELIPFITGESKIKFGTNYEYISNIRDVDFVIEGSGLKIISSNEYSCIITPLNNKYSKNTLIIEKDGEVLTSKSIIVSV